MKPRRRLISAALVAVAGSWLGLSLAFAGDAPARVEDAPEPAARAKFVALLTSVKPEATVGTPTIEGSLRAFAACEPATPVGRPPNRR